MPSVERTPVPRRRKRWNEEEDVRLLEAMEHYGFGNWEDVAKRIGSTKSPEDCKERYVSNYLQGPIGRCTWRDVKSESRLIDHMPADLPPVCKPTEATNCRDQLTDEELVQLGYMPNSDDYIYQFDHDAEKIVSNLTVGPDDDDLDVALKMALLCAYNRRIGERQRRKRVAREYGLPLRFLRPAAADGAAGGDAERRAFVGRLRVFAQLMPVGEFEKLASNLWGERAARRRLDALYRYRRHGVTRLDECRHFEQHDALRRAARPRRRGAAPRLCRSKRKATDSIYVYG